MIRLPILATTVFLLTSLPAAAHSDDARRYFGQIEGRVVTTDDAPVLGAEVGLDPRVIKTVSTDSEGLFTLRAVPEGSYRVIAAAPGFAVGEASIEVSRESPSPALLIRLPAAEVTLDSIDVVGSYSIGRDAPARSSALTAEQLRELPHFGDDIVRAVTVLPGVTSNDASAEFNVRGSLTREVRYEIDGLEIFEPYHLKDYQNIFSIIDPEMLGGVRARVLNGAATGEALSPMELQTLAERLAERYGRCGLFERRMMLAVLPNASMEPGMRAFDEAALAEEDPGTLALALATRAVDADHPAFARAEASSDPSARELASSLRERLRSEGATYARCGPGGRDLAPRRILGGTSR